MSLQSVNLHMDPSDQPDTPESIQLDPILDLVLSRIRLKAKRRVEWLRHLWSEEGESGSHQQITHAEVETLLADKDSPEAEAQWLHSNSRVTDIFNEIEQIEQAMAEEGLNSEVDSWPEY